VDFQTGGIPNYPALFQTSNPSLSHSVIAGTVFYRARLDDDAIGCLDMPSDQDMGAPPWDKAKAGRVNASGISVLYVGDAPDTAIYEMRPSKGARVHLAQCHAKTSLKVFDFTAYRRVRGLDPFSPEFEPHVKAASILAVLNDAFATPVAPHTPDRDYAPTQYIAELIRSSGYDGIKYRSAMAPSGVNYVFFSPENFEIRYMRSVKITKIKVEFEDYLPGLMGLVKP
jgi:hypothetical protein